MDAIKIDKNLLLSALSEVEFMVVSLDRIGSSELAPEEKAIVLYRFAVEGDVFQRLASIRRLLSSTLDENLSLDELDEFEGALEKVVPWKF
jgi:hypothetical protein